MVSSLRVACFSACSVMAFGVANAGVFFGGGVGVVDGLVAEVGYKVNPFISVRARATHLPNKSVSSFIANRFTDAEGSGNSLFNGVGYNVESKSLDIGLEIRPLPVVPILRSFTIIGSLQYLDADLTINKNTNGSVSVNGVNYNVNGYADAVISNKRKFAPYIGIGYDILNLPFISLRTTFGASIRSFEVSKANYNLPGVLQSDFDAEISALNRRVDKNVIVPSVTLTARITL